MRISRLILSGAAIGTIIGTGLADLNSLPRVAGVPVNLVPAALIPASCALGYLLHRHGR